MLGGAYASRRAGAGRAARTPDTGPTRRPERKKLSPKAAPALKSTPLWGDLDFSGDSLIAELPRIEQMLLECANGSPDLRRVRACGQDRAGEQESAPELEAGAEA